MPRMDVRSQKLPDDLIELKRIIQQQQAVITQKQALIDRKQKALEQRQRKIDSHLETISRKQTLIKRLEEQLRLLQQRRFGKSSEKNLDQIELQLFNEAELLDLQAALDEAQAETVTVPAHARTRSKPRALPQDLPRVEVVHDLSEADQVCSCGQTLTHIGDEVLEQLALIPQQYYVVRHLKRKYACSCKTCVRTATMPNQPLPASQASPQLLAQVMVSKYHDGLPLYRQEKMAARESLDLPRAKLARWMIEGARVFQPLWNLLQDSFFNYDIAWADETGIQVLKENGRAPENKSYLWIRRGGPPDQPVVLVDYSPSRSGETAYSLLDDFHGYLVCDAYGGYNKSIQSNGLVPVFCNDHARRNFADVLKSLGAKDSEKTKGWMASQAIEFYRRLYAIERGIKHLPPPAKLEIRQAQAVPLWDEFLGWAREVQKRGVAHGGTRGALAYLTNHAEGLRRYCEDGRLPISNILAEHVAKAIAVPRKNFLFADTPAGADASARIYSLLETAKANQHHPQRYLSVLLTELPNAACADDVEALLPWRITPEEVSRCYADYPTL
jgi:transposase